MSSTKIVIQDANGGIPSEAEGMAAVLVFLDQIHETGGDINDIHQTSDGRFLIFPNRLTPLSYNPQTGEMIPVYSSWSEANTTFSSCSNPSKCFKGCGCDCWISKGWLPSEGLPEDHHATSQEIACHNDQ